jgi:hypothetical protein
MSSPFAITVANNTVPLDKDQKGQALFTVSNMTSHVIHSRARIVSSSEAIASWLTLEGEAEGSLPAAGSQQYTVHIAAPPKSQAGEYTFHLNMVDLSNPDDNFTEGPTIKFVVEAPSAPASKPFPWWIVAVAVGVLILLSGGIYGINRLLHPAPVYCLQASTQSLAITGIETGADPSAQKVTLSNCGSTGNWTSVIKTTNGGAWLMPINPSGGTLSAGAKQDIVVAVTANPAGSAPLKAGTYTGNIVFTLGGRSFPIAVTFSVQPGPSANPAALTVSGFIGAVRTVSTVLTNNGGAGTVSVEVSTDDGHNWLSVNFANGTPISEGGMITVPITATVIFNAGGYTGHVKFIIKTSTGTASVTVTVHLNVTHF